MAANEAPENTKITGASTGSIILILVGTVTVTMLLAMISKNVAAVAKNGIDLVNQIEDLRNKKMLNAIIENQLREMGEKNKQEAHTEIFTDIQNTLPEINGEQKTALELAIRKLLAFNEKGGDVDFVAPEIGEEDEEGGEGAEADPASAALGQVRAAIRDYHAVREQIKLLEDQSR